MHHLLTDIHAVVEMNRPTRYQIIAKKKLLTQMDRRTTRQTDGQTDVAYDNNRYFFSKIEKNTKNQDHVAGTSCCDDESITKITIQLV